MPPVLHPGTLQPIGPADLAPLFPDSLIEQEVTINQMSQIAWLESVVQIMFHMNPRFFPSLSTLRLIQHFSRCRKRGTLRYRRRCNKFTRLGARALSSVPVTSKRCPPVIAAKTNHHTRLSFLHASFFSSAPPWMHRICTLNAAAAAAAQALGTPARIYYKYEGVSPTGSHKPNTAVPQAPPSTPVRRSPPASRPRRMPRTHPLVHVFPSINGVMTVCYSRPKRTVYVSSLIHKNETRVAGLLQQAVNKLP
jgi:hypothetical protein